MKQRLPYIAVLLAAFSMFLGAFLFYLVKKEGQERREQNCIWFETDHKDDVDQYRKTIEYLKGLNDQQRMESINRAVLANLGELRQEARTDRAPQYCDKPNVGLPEPDPVLPLDPFLTRQRSP